VNLEQLPALAEALHVRFGGREPFQIVAYYKLESELNAVLEATYQRCLLEGLIASES
jgi:hypothetical protein